MLKLIMLLLFFLGLPIISNAASVNDSNLTSIDESKSEHTKADKVHLLNGKTASEYEIALLSILKKNTMQQKMQPNTSNKQQNYLTNMDANNFINGVSNDEIDAQVLLETKETWAEIKDDLNYINILLNKVNTWTEDFLYKNIDPNLIFVFNVNETALLNNTESSSKNSQNTATYKNQKFAYADDGLPSNLLSNHEVRHNGGQNNYRQGDAIDTSEIKKNVFSLIYLWEEHSDMITVVLIILVLWLLATSLISILARSNR